jgi:hypothetical protein
LKLARQIGRTGGEGAKRRRREHHRALKTLTGDVHAAFTALLKAGAKRRTEEEHMTVHRGSLALDRIRLANRSALTLS